MDEEESSQDQPLISLGSFTVNESKRIAELLDKNNIPLEMELDESAIKNMHPVVARFGGTFGTGVQMTFYIREEDSERAEKLLAELYPQEEEI